MLQYYRFKDALNLFKEGKLEDGRKALGELQSEYISMADELAALKAQVQEYEDILYLARNLVFDGSAYWLMTGSLRQGPFCRQCYAERGRLVRLIETDGAFQCPACVLEIPMQEEETKTQAEVRPAAQAKILPFAR